MSTRALLSALMMALGILVGAPPAQAQPVPPGSPDQTQALSVPMTNALVRWQRPNNSANAIKADYARRALLSRVGYIADRRRKWALPQPPPPSPLASPSAATSYPNHPIDSFKRCDLPYEWAAWSSRIAFVYPRHGWCMSQYGYELLFQVDGNFVFYRTTDGRALWSPGTNFPNMYAGSGVRLGFLVTGAIKIFDAVNNTRWDNGVWTYGDEAMFELFMVHGGAIEVVTNWTRGQCYIDWKVNLAPLWDS